MTFTKKRNILFLSLFFIIIISLNASAVSAGTVTLSWDAPTTNEDGSPLTDLAGYKVYYGTSSGNYSQNINVGNVTTHTVTNLTDGLTYYFAVTDYNTKGYESGYSNEVSTTIPSSQYTLSVTKAGTGTGTVTSSPTGINCGSDCTETYSVGTVVTLTATPASGSTFTGWSGSGCSGTGTCSITINTNTTVTANFTIADRSITVTSPNGGETLNVGDTNTITWSSSNAGSNVNIDLSRDAGSTWSTLTASTSNDGSYSWNVSSPASSTCRVRITSISYPSVNDVSNANFTIAERSITVTSPNGGETLIVGGTHNITWSPSNAGSNVNIELSRNGGSTWESITNSTANDGSYSWNVTSPASSTCRVRITSISYPSVNDMSNSNFTIADRSIAVTSPNGGETWQVGDINTITWTSSNAGSQVKIDLSRDAGSTWSTLTASTSNDGSYSWNVSSPISSTCRVRITSISYPSVSDVSNANFTIAERSITVTSPNGGETLNVGDTNTITWSSSNAGSNVNIELSRNGGSTWESIANSTSNDGSYQWTVTSPASSTCKVRITSISYPSVSDMSNSNFTIAGYSITVTSPNGGEVIPSGSTYTVQWAPSTEAVKFDLMYSVDNGITWVPIPNASKITDTYYNWTIPKRWGNKKNKCLVRVIGYNGSNKKVGGDKSDAPFTIEVVKITSPNGGENLTSGGSHTIIWTTNGTKGEVEKVRLYYTKNGGVTWNLIDKINSGNPGSYEWTVPEMGKTKDQCKVKVELKDVSGNVLGTDTSDGYFTIQP